MVSKRMFSIFTCALKHSLSLLNGEEKSCSKTEATREDFTKEHPKGGPKWLFMEFHFPKAGKQDFTFETNKQKSTDSLLANN